MNKLPTILQLEQLDIILDDLRINTSNDLRVAEINNLRAVVRGALETLFEPDGDNFAIQVIAEMGARINHLVDNPDSAGNHNQFLNN